MRIYRTVNSPYFRAWNPFVSTLLTIFFSQPRNELLWWDHANLLLLRGDAVEKVCQACQQVFLLFLLGLVCQHILPEGPAEVQGLKHGVTVACVSELPKDNRDGSNQGPGLHHLRTRWGEGEGHPPCEPAQIPRITALLTVVEAKYGTLNITREMNASICKPGSSLAH